MVFSGRSCSPRPPSSASRQLPLLYLHYYCQLVGLIRRIVGGDREAVGLECFHDCFRVCRSALLEGRPGGYLPGGRRRRALTLARDVAKLPTLEARTLVLRHLGLRAVRDVVPGSPQLRQRDSRELDVADDRCPGGGTKLLLEHARICCTGCFSPSPHWRHSRSSLFHSSSPSPAPPRRSVAFTSPWDFTNMSTVSNACALRVPNVG